MMQQWAVIRAVDGSQKRGGAEKDLETRGENKMTGLCYTSKAVLAKSFNC